MVASVEVDHTSDWRGEQALKVLGIAHTPNQGVFTTTGGKRRPKEAVVLSCRSIVERVYEENGQFLV